MYDKYHCTRETNYDAVVLYGLPQRHDVGEYDIWGAVMYCPVECTSVWHKTKTLAGAGTDWRFCNAACHAGTGTARNAKCIRKRCSLSAALVEDELAVHDEQHHRQLCGNRVAGIDPKANLVFSTSRNLAVNSLCPSAGPPL